MSSGSVRWRQHQEGARRIAQKVPSLSSLDLQIVWLLKLGIVLAAPGVILFEKFLLLLVLEVCLVQHQYVYQLNRFIDLTNLSISPHQSVNSQTKGTS